MADDLKDEIRENASGPAKASGDAGSVEQHKLSEQIAADKHLASKDGVGKPVGSEKSNEHFTRQNPRLGQLNTPSFRSKSGPSLKQVDVNPSQIHG